LQIGANVLAGTDPGRILEAAARQLVAKREWPNPYGDGTTGEQIAGIVSGFFG
jgi:UDP-N-acetylglucosamine 2-epimerase